MKILLEYEISLQVMVREKAPTS